jgi:predicted  nucleic acid-binding Zn-ribbon protein
MNILRILSEGRVDDFREKYTHKFGSQNVERLVNVISPKYLDWVGKYMDQVNFEDIYSQLASALETFDKISNNLPLTDINQYRDVNQLLNAISEHKNKIRREIESHPGGNLVYEDDRFYVVNPLTHEASCYYGKGTKWCTAATGDEHFIKYNGEGKLFYVIDKRLQTSDPYYKVAILRNFDGGESYWDARDNSFSKGWILGENEYKLIKESILNYMNSEFSEQIKIFSDKELAKKEKERLDRVRQAQILREKELAAEERRLNGEWELNDDCPDVGLMAHALLDWLVDTSDVSALTNEDRVEIQRMKDEIERLNAEYEAAEDADTSLLDEISDLEDELSELEAKIDVYNIIPTGGHYRLTSFEVINSDDLDGREYAVGDNDEMQLSCEEYVEGLIDDIGYEGFNKGFASNYIDTDAVVDHARDFFEDDIYDSPESYFDDEDRLLSRKQVDEIKILNGKIERTRQTIEQLEGYMDDEEDEEKIEELENKISELEDLITDYETEIQDIEESPDGDFPQDLIDEKVEERLEDVRNDPEDFIKEWGLELNDFIDKDDFIQGVIDADGFGNTISSYDGNADEVDIEGITYWVIRIN